MDSVIRTKTKARVDLACPECRMDLRKAPNGGFAKSGETYCCPGCANGTGCTCPPTRTRKGTAAQNASVRTAGKAKHATQPKVKSHDQRQWDPRSKRLKTQNKPKVSTREQARGRSEQRGRLGRPANSENQDRISRTGSKGK